MTANAADTLSEDQRGIAALLWLDILVAGLLALSGSFAGNLFMVSLSAYATLLVARDAACILVRHNGYQRRAHRYEFGTGKLEQIANLAIAAGKVLVGFWLAHSLYTKLAANNSAPTQMEVSVYALITLVYTLRCASLAGISRTSGLATFAPIGRSARKRLLIAITMQLAITLAAVSENTAIVVAALSSGVLIMTLVLIQTGLGQARDAIRDLVDHPLDNATETQIHAVLRTLNLRNQKIIDVRARCAGGVLFVELTIAAEPNQPLEEARQRFAELRKTFETGLPGSDIVIRLA